jgi:hypothetical protein
MEIMKKSLIIMMKKYNEFHKKFFFANIINVKLDIFYVGNFILNTYALKIFISLYSEYMYSI